MPRAEILLKLLRLGPLEPLHTRHVCGWPVDEFESALRVAIQNGWVRIARGGNQHTTRLEATQ
jgi:hypothetical protein